ncbi:MAG: acyltransferase family protein, partial [Clostridia bacterium]|nr:acyltransferase family protein [Clostridia bacterium]
MKQHISYIDGIRGCACIMVFINHFLMAFFPASYLGADAVSHSNAGIDIWYSQSALSSLTNGNFWVCVFFIVSAFVISLKIMNTTKNNPEKLSGVISNSLIKRYPRLCFPVFAVCVLIFLCSRLGFFYNNIAAAITGSSLMTGRYATPLSLSELLSCGFIKIWFLKDETFSNSFWMLSTLFFGGLLSTVLSLMVQKKNRLILLIYLFFGLICIALSSLYLTFVIGTALAYLFVFHNEFIEQIKGRFSLQIAAWIL